MRLFTLVWLSTITCLSIARELPQKDPTVFSKEGNIYYM